MLTILIDPTLLPWERDAVLTVAEALQAEGSVAIEDIGSSHRRVLSRSKSGGEVWIVAHDWKRALRFLGVGSSKASIYVSIFGLPPSRGTLLTLLWRRSRANVPNNTTLLAHSPFVERFYREIDPVDPQQLLSMPLPLIQSSPSEDSKAEFVVGILGAFEPELNSNLLVLIAHYVSLKNPGIRFRIIGRGKLEGHIRQLISQFGVEQSVELIHADVGTPIPRMDLLLHIPLRNFHFLPIGIAGVRGIPVIAQNLPGLESLVRDNHSGFVVPASDTRSTAELILRLAENRSLSTGLGGQLREICSMQTELLAPYRTLFGGTSTMQRRVA